MSVHPQTAVMSPAGIVQAGLGFTYIIVGVDLKIYVKLLQWLTSWFSTFKAYQMNYFVLLSPKESVFSALL